MKKVFFMLLSIGLIVLALVACQPTAPAGPQIEISGAWGRPSPLAEGNGAAYMLIENTGSADDKLISAASDVSEATEIHDMTMENDIMKMFKIDGIDIPAGGSVELKPGSKHIMFIGLHGKLEIGQIVTIDLEFEKLGKFSVKAEIREP